MRCPRSFCSFRFTTCFQFFLFFFNDTATTEIYTLSLHDALPILSNIQTGAERMPHDLSHLGFLAGQIGRLGKECRSEERFSRNAETDLVCRLLLEKKKNQVSGLKFQVSN